MSREDASPMSQTEGRSDAKDVRLPITVWIEQCQEWHGTESGLSEPVRDWEDACLPSSPAGATRQDVEELGRRVARLTERIQALEQRETVPDTRTAPLA